MKVFNRVTSKHFSTKDDAPGRSWFVSVGKTSLLLISTIILTLGLSISFQSLLASWTAPVANPPTCTLGNPGCDSPLGSGTTLLQSMQGGLWVVNSAYPTSPYGLIVENGNVGIGTVAPTAKLQISDATRSVLKFNIPGVESFRMGLDNGYLKFADSDDLQTNVAMVINRTSGNVGIGTTNPLAKLNIVNSSAAGSTWYKPLLVYAPNIAVGEHVQVGFGVANSSMNQAEFNFDYVGGSGSNINTFSLGLFGATNIITMQGTGNVGIGTTNPTAKLTIGGTAGVDGIKFPDGTLQTTAASGGGALNAIKTYTSGTNATYTPTSGTSYIIVEVWGGGAVEGKVTEIAHALVQTQRHVLPRF
jgi:hypothetical protein